MKNWQKSLIIVAVIFVGVFASGIYFAMNGNTGFEEQYKFKVSKQVLIRTVEDFKKTNKEFIPIPKYGATDYLDTLTTQFVAYIYYPNEDTIICFFIDNKPNEPNKAYINLLSINEGLHDPVYKLVNKDFDRKKNLEIKKKFQERFLNKLNLSYTDEGNGNFIFWK